ncbi:MAG: hypothetical protein AAFU56_05685 [Pseudomonadota bacterium]
MTIKKQALGLAVIVVLAAACGQKTSTGVSYDSASKSDIRKACQTMLKGYAEAIPNTESQKREKKEIKPCCNDVAQAAGKLSGMERAYAAYDFLVAQDTKLTPNQIKSARTVRDAIAGDLTLPQRTAAGRLRYTGLTCMSQNARKKR